MVQFSLQLDSHAMALRHKLQKCLHGAMLRKVTLKAAKSGSEFYFRQRLLQFVLHQCLGLHGWLDREMLQTTCVVTPLRRIFTFIGPLNIQFKKTNVLCLISKFHFKSFFFQNKLYCSLVFS
jgi:hypothetical protein